MNSSRKTQTVEPDSGLHYTSNGLISELSAPSRQTMPPNEHNNEPQMSRIEVPYQTNAASQNEHSVSGGTIGSTEEDGVLVFQGRAGKNETLR